MDELEAFGSETEQTAGVKSDHVELELLVILQGKLTLAIEARHVESVVPWQIPAALPQTSPWVLGIIQDRGRLVAVRRSEQEAKHVSRVVLCTTSCGLIGVPATETRSIGCVKVRVGWQYGLPVDSDHGALTILNPESLAQQMTQA